MQSIKFYTNKMLRERNNQVDDLFKLGNHCITKEEIYQLKAFRDLFCPL